MQYALWGVGWCCAVCGLTSVVAVGVVALQCILDGYEADERRRAHKG